MSEESAASNAALIIASHTTSIKERFFFFFESEGFVVETLEEKHNPSCNERGNGW